MAKKRHYSSKSSGEHMETTRHEGRVSLESSKDMSYERDMFRPTDFGVEYYSGEKARRMQEMRDAGMITEDRSAIANLPQNVMMKPYPKATGYMPEGLDDTIRGVDGQKDLDNDRRSANFHPKKV